MSQSYGIKGGTTDEAFRSSVFCGKEELLSVPALSTFKTLYMHKNIYKNNTIKLHYKLHLERTCLPWALQLDGTVIQNLQKR